jgi:hypothetical protein
MRDLGDMGEDKFKYWCSSVGIIAHKPTKDKRGWDFFLEFPVSSNEVIPKDMQSAPIECKVQVKSTDKQNKKCQIEVSNYLMVLRNIINKKISF